MANRRITILTIGSRGGVWPPDHPTVAIRVNNLGCVMRAKGDYPGARTALQRALNIFERSLGLDHPNMQTVRVNSTARHLSK